jgi:ADP-heptose:LPS heptosyltransferase
MTIAFLHDQESDFLGGAELSNHAIIQKGKALGYEILYDNLKSFERTKTLVATADITVVNNIVNCEYESTLIDYLIQESIHYVKWEHDYGLCAKRSLYCFVESRVKNCCDNAKFRRYRNLFAYAFLNVFQSPMHYNYHKLFYGESIGAYIVLPPPISVKDIVTNEQKEKNTVIFLGDLNFIKGGNELVQYATEHPEHTINVFGQNRLKNRNLPANINLNGKTSNAQAMQALAKSEYFFFKPNMPEASGRVAAEAFLSGAKIISNDRVGTFSYDFYPEQPEEGARLMANAPNFFWEEVMQAFQKKEAVKTPYLGRVLVYKNYGGLGDRFIAIPAINKLKKVAEQVTVGVPAGLVNVFKRHTQELQIVPMKAIEDIDTTLYDTIINLGNYPKSARFDNEGVIDYPTHQKLKQHALNHYIDAIARFHPEIDNSYKGYPYFEKQTDTHSPYFTVHPGAGFSPKWWPTERYVSCIKALLKTLPHYRCVVILGPDDPKPEWFENIDRVTIETGNLDAVETQLSGAKFHIGNDSGITHFSGVFDIPAVGIHGLTGPGSWATMTSEKEIVWGKPGQCQLKCKYNVALNCEHRRCLTSISVARILAAVYKLIQNSKSMKTDQIKYVFNPEVIIKRQDDVFTISTGDKAFNLEFKDAEELAVFEDIVQHDRLKDTIIQPNLQSLMKALVAESIVFAIPM